MKLWLKVLLGACGVIIIGGGALFLSQSGLEVDKNNLPQFIQADFIDLSKIYSISKFRSGAGHDFSGNGETCRSMKHYFTPQFDQSAAQVQSDNSGLPPRGYIWAGKVSSTKTNNGTI